MMHPFSHGCGHHAPANLNGQDRLAGGDPLQCPSATLKHTYRHPPGHGSPATEPKAARRKAIVSPAAPTTFTPVLIKDGLADGQAA